MRYFLSLFLWMNFGAPVDAQNWLWAKQTIGTSNPIDQSQSVATDNFGNVYHAGYFNGPTITIGTYTLTNTNNYIDIYLAKYDSAGNVLWARSAGGSSYDYASSVATDAAGNIYVTGNFVSTSITFGAITLNNLGTTAADAFLVKYDPAGNVIWARSGGGSWGYEEGYSVDVDRLGNIFVTGAFKSPTITFGSFSVSNSGNAANTFVVKYDPSGNVLWLRSIVGFYNVLGNSICTDTAGNAYVTGEYYGQIFTGTFTLLNAGARDIFLVKFSAGGNALWAKSMGGTDNEQGKSVCTDPAGNVIFTGSYTSDSIAFGSVTLINPNPLMDVLFLAKYDSQGNLIWAQSSSGNWVDVGHSVSADQASNIYLTGHFQSSPFTFGSMAFTKPSNIQIATFIFKCDPNGNVFCGSAIHSQRVSGAVVADNSNNAYVTGEFYGSTFIVGSDTLFGGPGNGFLAKYTCCNSSPTTVISGSDTICVGDTIVLSASAGSTYSWSTGATTQTISISPTSATTYSVLVADSSGCYADTFINVSVSPYPTAVVTGNQLLCSGQTTTLTASGGIGYSWITGPTTNTIVIAPTTHSNYSVIVTNSSGCNDTLHVVVVVTPTPVAAIGPDLTICIGETVTLSASGGANYVWNTGATTSVIQISPNVSSNYSVVVANGNCKDTAIAFISVNANPLASVSGGTTIYLGQTASLSAAGGGSYSWSSGNTTSNIVVQPASNSVYCVTVSDNNNCFDTACTIVYVKSPCDTAGTFYLPNAFSPNGDGENDFLKIFYRNMDCIETMHLIIYDRWGEQVFESIDPLFEWDGKYRSKKESSKVFSYYLQVHFTDGQVLDRGGNVTVLR